MFRRLKRSFFSISLEKDEEVCPETQPVVTVSNCGDIHSTYGDSSSSSGDSPSSSKVRRVSSCSIVDVSPTVPIQEEKEVQTVVDTLAEVTELKLELSTVQTYVSSLHSAVETSLTCCSCHQLPRSLPISSCTTNHHPVCDKCLVLSTDTLHCPVCCSSLVTHTSPLLTRLLSTIRRPCCWSGDGCTVSSTVLTDLETHEGVCLYQPVLCWGCNSSYPLNTFDKHSLDLDCFAFKEVHRAPPAVVRTMLLCKDQTSGDVDWNPVAIKFAGNMFYLRIARRKIIKSWIFHVAAQQLPEGCSKYLAKITVFPPGCEDDTGLHWRIAGPPFSLLVKVEEAVRIGGCLVITQPAMERLMVPCPRGQGKRFKVKVEIEKCA